MAEWKPFDLTWGRSIYYCTECEESTEVPTVMGKPIYKYCPMCGAKMNADRKTEPTSSKMEQVEDEPQTDTEIAKAIVHKMIDDAVIAEDAYPDLRQKMHDAVDEYEPQTNEGQHVQRVEYIGNDEKSRCWTCKHFERMHETPIASDGNYYTYVVCTAKECHYEPKTEPQRGCDADCNEDCTECARESELWRAEQTEPQTEVKVEPTWVGVTYGRFEDKPHTERSE